MRLKVVFCNFKFQQFIDILDILHLTSILLYIGRYRPLFKLHQAYSTKKEKRNPTKQKWSINGVLMTTVLILLVFVNCVKLPLARAPVPPSRPSPKRPNAKSCPGCNTLRRPNCCVDGVVSDYFRGSQFENMFSNRNSLEAHAKGFWDYHSFISAAAHYQPHGFGITYINQSFFGAKEVAAFLAHVGTKTSCEIWLNLFFLISFY